MKTALLASYEKDANVLRLGKMLTDAGWGLLGSAGTARYLNENGIKCQDVAEIVGPPILGHRVVTLSRELHAGLLSTDKDEMELRQLGVPRIDLVYVTLYPLEEATANPASTPQDIIEKTDIGGPTLLRSAAKGQRLALTSPKQLDLLDAWLKGGEDEQARWKLMQQFAAAAERRVADYISTSASYLEKRALST